MKSIIYYNSKFDLVAEKVPKDIDLLLDLGCRNNILKKYIPSEVNYVGMDLFQNEHQGVNVVANIEDGIPFPDGHFDVIVGLDLFEHLNDIQKSLIESLNKLKNGGLLIIQLPNLSHLGHRLDYLFNGRFTKTDKYKLSYNYGLDRHRWFTTMIETDEFIAEMSKDKGLSVEKFSMVTGKLKGILPVLNLLSISDAIYAKSAVYIIKK
jgi:SAM-dependent methyltransferase